MNKLLTAKEIIDKVRDDRAGLITINKKTKWNGCAIIHDDLIYVFEGNPDGSDDKQVSYEEFVENYEFFLDSIENERGYKNECI